MTEPNAKICRKCKTEYIGTYPQGNKCPKCGGRLVYAIIEENNTKVKGDKER